MTLTKVGVSEYLEDKDNVLVSQVRGLSLLCMASLCDSIEKKNPK